MNKLRSLLLSPRQRMLVNRLESERKRLFRMVYAWSHDPDVADDVVQEAMIKAIDKVDSLKDIKALDGWVFRILHNCFYDHLRKQREQVDIDDVVLVDDETPEQLNDRDEMLTGVRQAISQLPVKYREVVTLVDIESFSYAEVAEIIGVPIGTVMSRLNRARQKLKTALEAYHPVSGSSELKVVR